MIQLSNTTFLTRALVSQFPIPTTSCSISSASFGFQQPVAPSRQPVSDSNNQLLHLVRQFRIPTTSCAISSASFEFQQPVAPSRQPVSDPNNQLLHLVNQF